MISGEVRPWGKFEVLIDDPYTKVKRLVVNPGQRLSYQSHQHRAEQWTVVKGTATVTLNDIDQERKYGEHIEIPRGAKHRLANLGTEMLEVVEVQTGDYFGEDDIVRYQDDHGRV